VASAHLEGIREREMIVVKEALMRERWSESYGDDDADDVTMNPSLSPSPSPCHFQSRCHRIPAMRWMRMVHVVEAMENAYVCAEAGSDGVYDCD